MDREENKRTSLKAELPPLENIFFRVQLGVYKEIDEDLILMILFHSKEQMIYTYFRENLLLMKKQEYRNEIYFLGHDDAKVIALKDGVIVNAEEYMDWKRRNRNSCFRRSNIPNSNWYFR